MENFEKVFEKQKNYFYKNRTRSIEKRIRVLKKIKSLIQTHEKDIIEAIQEDFGKSEFEVYTTELGQVYEEINTQIRNIREWSKAEPLRAPISYFPAKARMVKEPYGVTLIISPFNYPFSLLFIPLVGAIATGNCAMLKPSELTPKTSAVIAKIINSNFNKGFIYVCDPSEGKCVVQELLELPFDYIFFTGSERVGKIVMESAAKNLTPITLELGGKSPCIVTRDSNIKMAAKRIVWGKFINAGQTCVAPDYILVEEEIKETFLERLVYEIKKQYPTESADYCGIITSQTVERLKSYLKDGTIYFGGKCDAQKKIFEPTVLVDVKENSPVMTDEIFGPILPVLTFRDLRVTTEKLKRGAKPLALYIFSKNAKKIAYVLKNISAGGTVVNDTIIQAGSSAIPFGGVGASGMGSYHGKENFNTFSHRKAVVYRGTWMELDLRFAPYSNRKLRIIKKFYH